MVQKKQKQLLPQQQIEIINILKTRFSNHTLLNLECIWSDIEAKLKANAEKLWSLNEMEKTGGEPNLFSFNKQTDEYIFCDFAAESPAGRRSLCYDTQALETRKTNKPKGSALATAAEMGVEILDEVQYQELQKLGKFDTKTSSWLLTPTHIRQLGGAIFGDWRYGQVFTYHNGAESYYAGRGFRSLLRV